MCLCDNYRRILPGEKIETAFLFQAGTVWPSWESVYQACQCKECFDVRLILVSETTVEVSHSIGAEEYLKQMGLPYERCEDIDFEQYHPHIAFIQFPYDAAFHTPDMLSLQFVRRGTRIVYIPYGIEIADTEMARNDHFNSRVVENAWKIYISSDGILNEYKKYCRNRNAVKVTGSPKFDCIVCKKDYPISSEINKLAAGKKIVIWKIHFPKKNKIDGKIRMITPELREYLDFADQLEKFSDFFFVVLPHPKMVGRMVTSDLQGDDMLIRDARRLIEKIEGKQNAYIDNSVDYRHSLYHADAIIIDRSATMVEAVMLGVPVLLMQNASYTEPLTIPVQRVMDVCEHGTTCEDICAFLENLRRGIIRNTDGVNRVVSKWFPFLDGKCGERIVKDIWESIDRKNKRNRLLQVVLYGTGEVASYYMEKQHWTDPKHFCVLAVADSDKNKQGGQFYGYRVISPEEIRFLEFDVIVVMTEPYFYEIQKNLVYDLYLDDRKILRLDEFITALEEEVVRY